MEKLKIKTKIFSEEKDAPFTWGDIKHIEFQDDDELTIVYDDDENCYIANIYRIVEETDEQYNQRIHREKLNKEWAKELRYKKYLVLKEEFEK